MAIEDLQPIVFDKKDDTFSNEDSDVEDTVVTFNPDAPRLDPPQQNLPRATGGFHYMEDMMKDKYDPHRNDLFENGAEPPDFDKMNFLPDAFMKDLHDEKIPTKPELDKLTERYRAVIASWKD